MRTPLTLSAFAAFALSACAMGFQPYPAPTSGVGVATIHVVRDAEEGTSAGFRPAHWFFAYDNPDCMRNSRSGFLGAISWDVGSEFRRVLSAGERVYVRSITRYAGATQSSTLAQIYCTTVTSFTPAAGGTYRISQDGLDPSCPTIVIDPNTGQPPPDARPEPVGAICAAFNGRSDG